MEGKRNGQNTHGIDKGIDKCTGEKEQRQQSLALPRVLIGAAGSGSGKTSLTCGLLQALKQRKLHPVSFKCGPDYIDPMFHTEVLGVPSHNLDLFFTSDELTCQLMAKAAESHSAQIAVIEGVMGFYDGLAAISPKASSFDLARATRTPAILLVDCKGKSLSVIAEIQGFLAYEALARQQLVQEMLDRGEAFDAAGSEAAVPVICGVILNRLSPMLYPDIKKRIEEQLPVQVLGYLPVMKDCGLESRHLGLVTAAEIGNLQEIIDRLATQVEQSVDLDGILRLAQQAPPVRLSANPEDIMKGASIGDVAANGTGQRRPRIAVARDRAFCFYYQDNLNLLKELGAELVAFSPLTDARLPEGSQGLYIGGGYPELYLKQLSENTAMQAAIREAVNGGMPCVAECGGFMYLHEHIRDSSGNAWPMVGVLEGESYAVGGLKRFGYVQLMAQKDTLLCRNGEKIRAHEFHYWDSTQCGDAFLAEKPLRNRSWQCIIARENLFAGYPHLYFYSNPTFARRFVEACGLINPDSFQSFSE